MASSASTLLRQTVATPPEEVCTWTDDELKAMCDEADAKPGESIDGAIVFKDLMEGLRQRVDVRR